MGSTPFDDHLREEKKVTAIHEAGHALLAVMLPHADPVHKVTIIPRGMALGVTMQLPEADKHNYTRDYLNDRSRSCSAAVSPKRSPPAA
jgi:ATP-dependent Zn protease